MFGSYSTFGRRKRMGRRWTPGMGRGIGRGMVRGFGRARAGGWAGSQSPGRGWSNQMIVDANQLPNDEQVRQKAREIFQNIKKGAPMQTMNGLQRIPLLYGNAPVGELFEDVDLNKVEFDGYWPGRFNVRVNLVENGKIVGYLCIPY